MEHSKLALFLNTISRPLRTSSISKPTTNAPARMRAFALTTLLTLSGVFLIATLTGCASEAEKYNKELAQQEYRDDHNACWKLFSRIDPEKKKEYQKCMKKRGWSIK